MDAGKRRHPAAWTRRIRRFFRPFLTLEEKSRVDAAVAGQERLTGADLTVLVLPRAGREGVLPLAERKFLRLKLDRSPKRDSVLILITHLDHQFAIWADVGLAGADWAPATEALTTHFRDRRYADGIVACVEEVGRTIATAS